MKKELNEISAHIVIVLHLRYNFQKNIWKRAEFEHNLPDAN